MPRQFINTLCDGQSLDEVYLLADRQLRANRNADLYLLVQMKDRTGQVSGLLWNASEQAVSHIEPGMYVHARGKVQLFQGNLQVILNQLHPADVRQVNPDDFRQTTGAGIEHWIESVRTILMGIKNKHLRTLMEVFFEDPVLMEGLRSAPAGIRMHHAHHGGLIEHINNLLQTANRLVDLYPQIDFDLLHVGIFLHDIGKLRELGYDATFNYTDEGQLIGHLVIAVEMLNEKIPLVEARLHEKFPQDARLRIKHMILSHHGSYEFGSCKLPMTPEAIALHHLDTLDAKVNEFASLIAGDPNASSNWTPFHPTLQRKLFKGIRG